jgi:4-amino-4-deoxy-L-arabinose transferase-like glycosyltransferase
VVVERRWSALARFLISGALLTAVVIGGWWFLYVRSSPHAGVLAQELRVVAGGEDHVRPFYMYFPQTLVATAPWTGLFLLGLVWAVADWRRSPAARVVLIWAGSILLPLCCIGNKQIHYLVPMIPSLAMLAAYALHRGLGADAKYASAARWAVGLTLAVSALAPVGVYLHARHQRGFLETLDLALVALLLAGVVGAISLFRRHGFSAAAVGYAAGVAMAFAVAFGRWLPSLEGVSHRTIAADLRGAFAGGPYAFYGRDPSFPLIWNLRALVPTSPDEGKLQSALQRDPATVVIAQVKNNRQPPPIPGRLQLWREFPTGEEGMIFRIYVQEAKE